MIKFHCLFVYIISFCSFLIGCATSSNIIETPEWWEQRKETEAFVYHVSSLIAIPNYAHYTYIVNDSIYEDEFMTRYLGIFAENSKYLVAYNPDNPKENLFLEHKPIFENHQMMTYNLDLIPQDWRKEGFRETGIIIFEKNEKTINTICVIGEARQLYLGNDSIISVSYNYKAGGDFFEYIVYRELNNFGYISDSLSGKIFMVQYIPSNPLRSRVLLNKPIIERKRYTLKFIDLNKKTEKELNKVARKIGNGGVVYWSPRNEPASMLTIAKMKDFLKTYIPRDRRGRLLDVEIKIVDYNNLDELFEEK